LRVGGQGQWDGPKQLVAAPSMITVIDMQRRTTKGVVPANAPPLQVISRRRDPVEMTSTGIGVSKNDED
jgi:hypothetical protein